MCLEPQAGPSTNSSERRFADHDVPALKSTYRGSEIFPANEAVGYGSIRDQGTWGWVRIPRPY